MRLVEQRQHHRVDRGGLARTRGAADQQVRHAAQVGDDRVAADVLAEHQRDRRRHVVVGLRLDDLAERDHLARLVRDLEAHRRLARNDLDHAHADGRQRAREVFREVRDLRNLDARRRAQLEARDDRARMHFDDFGLDAEIAQLQFDQARHGLERFGGVAADTRGRIVEQRQRRQRRGARPLEQRDLLFFLDALALLDLGRRRLDLRRLALGDLLLLFAHDDFARLLHFLADALVAALGHPLAHEREATQHPVADEVHDVEPRHAGGQRDRAQPDGEQQQRRAEEAHRAGETLAEQRADDTARRVGETLAGEMQRGEAAAARERQEEAEAAERGRATVDGFAAAALLEQAVARDAQHDREQVGRQPEQHEEQVGQPGAERADQVGDRAGLAGRGKRGVRPVVTDQGGKQDQCQRTEDPERAFAQSAGHVGRLVAAVGALRFRLSQSSSPDSSRVVRNPLVYIRLPPTKNGRHLGNRGRSPNFREIGDAHLTSTWKQVRK